MEESEIKDSIEELDDKFNSVEGNSQNRPVFKREKPRFEFALFINDFLICKRGFQINGYVEKSMQTPEFKAEIDKVVDLIHEDLAAKTRVYTWYHYTPEFPEWEPEIMTDPLIEEGNAVLKFVVYDNWKEVISKVWDARYYPTYVRKNIDLTNRQVKIVKGEDVTIHDKDSFFADRNGQLPYYLTVLRAMICGRDDLIPAIQKLIYEVCSSFDGYYEKISDYHLVEEYDNCDIMRDADGKPMYRQKTIKDANGNELPILDAFGNPWMVPVLANKTKGKRYNINIEAYNKKIDSMWGASVAEKTKKYMSELYVTNKDRFYKKG